MLEVVWVEIPVKDLERAIAFYQAAFQLQSLEINEDGVRRTTNLYTGSAEGAAGISLNQTSNFEPSDQGPLAYLQTGENINDILPRVEAAGGSVTMPKTSMGAAGNFAMILDSEGNALALYDAINDESV